jgi:nicotinamide-nucleotide amidase
LLERGESLATAEMFTGGAIAARFVPRDDAEDPFLRGVVSRDLGQMCDAVGLDTAIATQGLTADTAMAIASALRAQSGAGNALVVLIELDDGADRIEFGGTINIGLADADGVIARTARMLGGRDWVRLGATDLGIDCLRRRLQGLPVDERIDFEKR